MRGLGLPDTPRAIQNVLGAIKDGAVPRRYPTERELSPYNTGLMLAVLSKRNEPSYTAAAHGMRDRLIAALDTYFPDSAGRDVNEFAQMPVIGTSRVLLGLASAGLRDAPGFRNALCWILAQANDDGGFGLARGDRSRVFATSAVAELLMTIDEHRDVLERIAAFIMDSYDAVAQSWMVFGGSGGINGGALRSSSALAIETWSYLKRADVLSGQRSKEFAGTVEHVRHQLAENLPVAGAAENATLELSKVRPVPLFHFTLLHCLKALVRSGVMPGEWRVFEGLRALTALQDQSGGFQYGTDGEVQLWATVEAISCLTDVEEVIAAAPQTFTAGVLSGLAPGAGVNAGDRQETKEAFAQACRQYCDRQLIPELGLHNTAYSTGSCFLIGETGWLFGAQVHVIAEHLAGEVTEDTINRWLMQATTLKAKRLIVLTNRRVSNEQYRAIWAHNEQTKHRVETRTI